MPITGEKCERSGTYRSKCKAHEVEIPLKRGSLFPNCPRSLWDGKGDKPRDYHFADWELIESENF